MRLIPTAALLLVTAGAHAAPKLPAILSDNMVLQRATHVPIWGKADPGEKLGVVLGDPAKPIASADTVANAEGRWQVMLDTSKAPDQPTTLTVSGSAVVTAQNVLVGQVWLCSGQSNMEWKVESSNDAAREIAAGNYPQIRHFHVPHVGKPEPTEELTGEWRVASPATVGQFSAVAYFFGRELHSQLKTPIGLIHSSWGGTPAELWTDRASLRATGEFNPALDALDTYLKDPSQAQARFVEAIGQWKKQIGLDREPGETAPQATVDLDVSAWKPMEIPSAVESVEPDFDGVYWIRREVVIDSPTGAARLRLGPIDDWDITYVNGRRVGSTGMETDNAWATPRAYDLPDGLLKPGKNVIAIRVSDYYLAGGLRGDANASRLEVGDKTYPLAGTWKYQIESQFTPAQKELGSQAPIRPGAGDRVPGRLYNAMLFPLKPYAIAGAIWYQGEANVTRDEQYRKLLPALISSWRSTWNQTGDSIHRAEGGRDFPFYIVQLANFQSYRFDANVPSPWAALRDAQTFTARSVPNTGMAVAIDIGDARDIHPRNKQEVGRRLALLALRDAYGHDLVASGPQFTRIRIDGGRILVQFDQVADGLKTRALTAPANASPEMQKLLAIETDVRGFAVRANEGEWKWAKARIVDRNTVEVSSDEVPSPTMVRYAWADNPVANLYNSADLPAVPFRSDDPQYKP